MFKKTCALLIISLGFATAQVNEDILSEFDLIAEMASKEIRKAIFDGIIPADIAITSFGAYGFTENEKKYFQEVMNRIFYSDVSFKLISIPESQTIQVEETDDKLIIKKGASKNSDLRRYAESINSKHYGEIYIFLMSDNIYMKILVHDAYTGDVVWSGNWSAKRDNRFTAELGYAFGFGFFEKNIYHFLHTFFGSRAVGLGEFGLSIDLGMSHSTLLLTRDAFGAATSIGDIGVSLILAPKVSINFMELAKRSYVGVDAYAIFKPGLKVDSVIFTDDAGSGAPLYFPSFYFSADVGFGFAFREINLDLLFNVNPKGGFIATAVAYYKF